MAADQEAWAAYYEELDPGKRLSIYTSLEDSESPLDNFRRDLYRQRYNDPKHPDRRVDTWLWKLVYLPGLYKRRVLLKNPLRHEMESTVKELHLEHPENLPEDQREALYLEFCNTARRYLSTCGGERYASRFMGLKKATEEEKRKQACEEIWMASRGLALTVGLEDQMKLWSDALYKELLEYDPSARKHYEELEEQFREKYRK